jgi:hypothetical protein
MKRIFFAATLLPLAAPAQRGVSLEIKPYIVKVVVVTTGGNVTKRTDTCVKLVLNPCGIVTKTTGCVNYQLFRADGSLYETGDKIVPRNKLDLLNADPVNITAINNLLINWYIEAINEIQ